jgi:hypothetical protein
MRARLVWYCLARLRVPCARLVSAARPRAASRPGEAAEGKAAISLAARCPPPPPSLSLSRGPKPQCRLCCHNTAIRTHALPQTADSSSSSSSSSSSAAAAAAAAAAGQQQQQQQRNGTATGNTANGTRQSAWRCGSSPLAIFWFRLFPLAPHARGSALADPVANRKGQASGSFCGMRRLLKSKAVELQHLQNGAANPPASARGLLRHVVQVPRASLPSHRAIGIGASFCSRRLGLCPALRGGAAHRASCTSKAVFPVALCRQPRRLLKSACFSCCC